MTKLKELFEQYLSLDYDQLLSRARELFSEVSAAFKRAFGTENSAAQALLITIFSCLSIDGKLTDDECRFLSDIFGFTKSYDEINNTVESLVGAVGGYMVAYRAASLLTAEERKDLVSFCLCFLVIDKELSENETAFIKKLLDQ